MCVWVYLCVYCSAGIVVVMAMHTDKHKKKRAIVKDFGVWLFVFSRDVNASAVVCLRVLCSKKKKSEA